MSMSALPPKADIHCRNRNVRFGWAVIFSAKSKRARTTNKDDSRPITEVTDELIVRSCDPTSLHEKRAYGLEIL